jgi:ABC-2 type transport system ATP-binding protein
MKQRLGIACSLLGNPDLLFLDEPTNGMDPAGMAEVRELVRGLGDGDRTVLLSSHLLHEVEQVCDSVAILSRGKLIAQGAVTDLLHSNEGVRLFTTDDSRSQEILADLDWVEGVTAKGQGLDVSAPIARSWELTRELGNSQVYVTEMWPLQVSLEQYFLDVTAEDEGVTQ